MSNVSILIIDDESNIRLTVRAALESDGYSVEEASNGKEALLAIGRLSPDLVVLDLNMPVLDGMEVLEQLKSPAIVNKPRVIVLTAYGSIATAVKATRLGAVDFLEKPITPVELRQAIRSILNEPEIDNPPTIGTVEPGDYEQALSRVRNALRVVDYSTAESLLEKAAQRKSKYNAEYYNLLGVLYEAQQKWRLARRCYGKAIAADKRFEPAQANMRRLFELHTYGRSHQAIMLGDETDEPTYAPPPRGGN
jgi:DNA-binding response OmpR family regulator